LYIPFASASPLHNVQRIGEVLLWDTQGMGLCASRIGSGIRQLAGTFLRV
jgi:hypothetical protein